MHSSLAEAQAQLRSDGIALDIKTLRLDRLSLRCAGPSGPAERGDAVCWTCVTGKRVVVSLDGAPRPCEAQEATAPRRRRGATDSIRDWKEPKYSTSSCTSSATTGDRLRRGPRCIDGTAPGTGGGLSPCMLSYATADRPQPAADKVTLHRRRRALDLATSSSRLIAAARSSRRHRCWG